MDRRHFCLAALGLPLAGALAGALSGPARARSPVKYRIQTIADGFRVPWAVGVLPGGDMLVTERAGGLWRVTPGGQKTRITGTPEVAVRGQGGLLDLAVARDFARSGEVFLSYARAQPGGGAGTALAVARLDGARLTGLRRVFELTAGSRGGRHFGGRIVEARDGTLFLTVGDRGEDAAAQDLSRENGSVVRVARDGTIPADNPFAATAGARPAIWSYGHRNPQGAALDAQGRLWLCEHGAKGGDEVNQIEKGANYGWPVISYGTHYSGAKIGEGTSKPGMKQPAFYWDPSIAPSGLAILSQDRFPGWRGAVLTGSLKFDHIAVLAPGATRQIARIQTPETARVRDVREAPDGSVLFLSEGNGALYRIVPG